MVSSAIRSTLGGLLLAGAVSTAQAALVATYQFGNSLSADQAGAPALTAINDGGFVSDTVFGQGRTVYERRATSAANQSGLLLDTNPLGLSANSYAVEIVFTFTDSFDGRGSSGYRRVVDSRDPGSLTDPGFYIGFPNQNANIYFAGPHAGGPSLADGTYYDVVLNVAPSGEEAYVDGVLATALSGETPDATQSHFINFFIDEAFEYGNGKVALLRVFDGPLSADEVSALHNGGNPFPSSVPLPASGWLMLPLLAGLGFRRRR